MPRSGPTRSSPRAAAGPGRDPGRSDPGAHATRPDATKRAAHGSGAGPRGAYQLAILGELGYDDGTIRAPARRTGGVDRERSTASECRARLITQMRSDTREQLQSPRATRAADNGNPTLAMNFTDFDDRARPHQDNDPSSSTRGAAFPDAMERDVALRRVDARASISAPKHGS